ncbi:MAG: response regulator [Burkholderiales bacterium]
MQIGVDSSTAVDSKRLFVVDNDEITRMALTFMLHDENETHDLSSLEAAFEKSREWKPDLLLLGLDVVEEKGMAALSAIKSGMQGVKILMVVDKASDPKAQECLQSGADGLLGKPLTIESVRRKVDVLLGRKQQMIIPLQAI